MSASILERVDFVDEGTAIHRTVDMRTELQREYQDRPARFIHSTFKTGAPWPRTTDIWCWHCAHSFTTMPVPLVSRYDHERRLPICYGIFCSPNCARAYAREHKPLSWTRTMIYYSLVLHKSFGINPSLSSRPAWPKERLKVFGGDLSIEEFREGFTLPTVMRVETVSFAMQNTSIIEICPDQFLGVSVGANPEVGEKELLGSLAKTVIDRHRTTQLDAVSTVSAAPSRSESIAGNEDGIMETMGETQEILSVSVLESFFKNHEACGGDVDLAKEVTAELWLNLQTSCSRHRISQAPLDWVKPTLY